ncbi:MAG: ABC transporter permease [Clostridium sp.]
MFIKLLGKEITQFRRNKGNILLMFLFPIILITILGTALSSMMGSGVDIFNDGKIYYTITEESHYSDGFKELITGFENEFEDIVFEETISPSKAEEDVNNNKAYAYVTITSQGYKYYRNPTGETTQSKIFRSIFENVINKYTLIDIAKENNPQSLQEILSAESKSVINNVNVGNRAVSAVDYYTFAELALIILYISIIVGESVCKEKEEGTYNRIAISKAHPLTIILSKITLGIVVGVIQIITVYIYSSFILDAKWGDNLLPMLANLLCLTIFASVLGAFIGSLMKNSGSLNGALNMVIVFSCLLGGCYTPISMIKAIPVLGNLTVISPIYWVNSALISLSTGVKDKFSIVAISLTLGLSIVMIIIYLCLYSRNRRDISA